jgi:hypothetical protein
MRQTAATEPGHTLFYLRTARHALSEAARHSWYQNPETKPDLISVTQYIESRSVNVISHAALYELTS